MGAPLTLALQQLRRVLDVLADPDTPEAGCPITPRPCRISLYPGDVVAFDTCQSDDCTEGDGQLWANLLPATVENGGGGCAEVTVQAQIGIVRCAPMPDAQGWVNPEAVQTAAFQQAIDADHILNTLTCCEELTRDERFVFTPVSWAPVPEQGGCVGGVWTVSLRLSVCCDPA